MRLRNYQQECVGQVLDSFRKNTSSLVVMPTGTGKTVVFGHIANNFIDKGRVLVVAHRDELLEQAGDKLQRITGYRADIEKAESYAPTGDTLIDHSPLVVASVQSLISGKGDWRRVHRFDPQEFSLVIVDEAHHSVSDSYIESLNHFRKNPNLKILGVTATPDRADEAALGRVFEDVAYEYSIVNAISDGWLVPIRQQVIHIDSIDYSDVKTTAGDLNGADLERVLLIEKNLHGMAVPTLDICGDRKTIVFTVTVKQAERLAEILNRYKENSAIVIHGKTPEEERKEKTRAFRDGEYQFFVNVGIATEGFDVPDVHCIVMGRPTKSRSLYSQMLGRGTRPLAGLVDGLEMADERKQAIELSAKPEMLVIDFVGNSGRHAIVHAADILGGDYEDEVVELAKREMAKAPKRVDDALVAAEKELRERRERAEAERRAKVKAKVSYVAQTKDVAVWYDVPYVRDKAFYQEKQLSEKQIALLERAGFVPEEMSYAKAKAAIVQVFKRMDKGLCSYKQAKLLEKWGYKDTKNITKADASRIIDEKFGNKKSQPVAQQPRQSVAVSSEDVPW